MTRSHRGLLSHMIQWKWQTLLICCVVGYGLFAWLLPRHFPLDAFGRQMGHASRTLAPAISALFLALLPIAWLRQRKEARLLSCLVSVEALRLMSWEDLEILVRAIFARQGYSATRRGGYEADGGVDVVLKRSGFTTLVQCKQWRARQVPVAVIRELLGAITAERAAGGMVVTCGSFTGDAWAFAQANNIKLIDGVALVELAATVRGLRRVSRAASLAPHIEMGVAPLPCPLCKGLMRSRTSKGLGPFKRTFWGCARFPTCRGTRQN